jgi:hypothetical protein
VTTGNTLDGVRLIDPDSPPTQDQNVQLQANEGDLKSERELTFEPAQTRIETFAVWTRVSRQLLADVPLLSAALGDLFQNAVASKMERSAVAKLVSEATAFAGGFIYRPTTSRTFAINCGSGEILNEREMCGFRPKVRQMRPIIVWLMPALAAIFRVLQ